MAFDKSFSDEIKKEIAYKEYEIESYNQDVRLKTGEYIGNVAHIYDNVNDNEEQVFVVTNNGQGEKQKAVPYTASDDARAQIHDVTVLMKGSETEISTQKLLHDTFTDWVGTDLPAASNILNPGGASEYATEYAKNYARDKAKDSFNNAVEAFEDGNYSYICQSSTGGHSRWQVHTKSAGQSCQRFRTGKSIRCGRLFSRKNSRRTG